MRKENERIDYVDQFFRLPEPLVHIILSYLPVKELCRTSILANRWKNLWISTASKKLIFNGDFFGKEELCRNNDKEVIYAKREYLMNLVERILRSRHNQNVSLEELELHVPSFKSDMKTCLDRCINYAIGCNVERLNFVDVSRQNSWYHLPRTIFTSKTLTSLSLHRCKLESLSCYSLSSLKMLRFLQVSADDQIVQNLIANCPAIEVLRLRFCLGAKGTLNISGLVNSKLVSAEICYCQFGRVEIDVPSIESLDIGGDYIGERCEPCEINVSTCRNVKKLSLTRAAITDKWFHDHLSNLCLFEVLEYLSIENCDMVETIKISSYRLKHLSVCRCMNLVKVEIDDPSLRSFTYAGQKVISFSSNALNLSKVYIWLNPPPINVDSLWYTELTKFLGKFNNSKRLNMRSGSYLNLIVPKQLRESSPPPLHNVKHLVLEVDLDVSSPTVIETIDVLLWFAPHPVTIKISSIAKYKTWVLKFKYKEMDKDGNPCCCFSPPIKCWRRCIEEVKIKRSRGAEDEWYKVFFLNTPIVEED